MMLLGDIALLFAIVFLLFLLSMIWPPDSPWAPWWRTNRDVARAICRLANISKNDTVYDLGCGDGTALLTAATQRGARGVGIEIDPVRVAIARFRVAMNGQQKNITIIKKNFFEVPINDASIVIVYLVPKALLRLKQKFLHELKPGTKVVSYRYQLDYLPLVKKDMEHALYLYEIPKEKPSNKKKA